MRPRAASVGQDGAKVGQDRAKVRQDGAKVGQDKAKVRQDGAKMRPQWSPCWQLVCLCRARTAFSKNLCFA